MIVSAKLTSARTFINGHEDSVWHTCPVHPRDSPCPGSTDIALNIDSAASRRRRAVDGRRRGLLGRLGRSCTRGPSLFILVHYSQHFTRISPSHRPRLTPYRCVCVTPISLKMVGCGDALGARQTGTLLRADARPMLTARVSCIMAASPVVPASLRQCVSAPGRSDASPAAARHTSYKLKPTHIVNRQLLVNGRCHHTLFAPSVLTIWPACDMGRSIMNIWIVPALLHVTSLQITKV